jgi:hypothetical protein
MKPIEFPLKSGDQGEKITNLQNALLLLVDKKRIQLPPTSPTHGAPDLVMALTQERRTQAYKEGTAEVVRLFREQARLAAGESVDKSTAKALNAALKEAGAIFGPASERVVAGQVRDEKGHAFGSATVKAIHLAEGGAFNLGEDVTNAEGRYTIRYAALPKGESVDLRVIVSETDGKVLRESGLIHDARVIEIVDLVVPSGGEPLVVRGSVRNAAGEPQRGMTIMAYDRDLRSEQELGRQTTGPDGRYEIHYRRAQFRRVEKGSADLVIKAFAAPDLDGPAVVAPTVFNAPSPAEVNLTIPRESPLSPSLFERVGCALEPLRGKVKVAELEEDKAHQDLSFLSGETGLEKFTLARFVLAHRLAQKGLPAQFWFVLLGGSFYQFNENQSIEAQSTAVLDALSSLDSAAVGKALTRGFNEREIAEGFRKNSDAWVAAFLKFTASHAVRDSIEPTFVKSALSDAGISDAKRQLTFARLFNEYRALTPELLAALGKDTSFRKKEIADLRTSFALAELTRSDFSVVKTIKEAFEVREPQKLRALAKKSEAEWVSIVTPKRGAGETKLPDEVNLPAGKAKPPVTEIQGKVLERQFREAFPTAAFTGGLERASKNGGTRGISSPEVLQQFLNQHEDFEFLTTSIDDFLKDRLNARSRRLAEDDSFRTELKAIQRVFKLVPNFAATDSLLADDLHSAQKVYRIGKSEFVQRYGTAPGFTPETALLAWNRAADTHAAVLTIVGDLNEFDAGILPGVLKSSHPALENFPNWNNLFKTGDLCDCDHCRSVLGPAAYFADLLMFLRDRSSTRPKPGGGFHSVKDILLDRRADLGYLELNCANALTTFPYVDTVCEVLEDAVDTTGANDLELTGFVATPAGPAAAKAAVSAAFSGQKVSLGAAFSLTQVNPANPDLWVVHGDDITYLLKKKPPSLNFFAKILRNTKGTAADLRAYPPYVNAKAYAKLRQAKHPLTLPFDLFAEEVRAAFQKANLQRWDLMRTFRGSAAPNNPTKGEIAAEYFGISADPAATFDEKRLILVADSTVAGQQTIWRETGAGWLNTVGNVKKFLHKTSLEYNDLFALLDLEFLNPAGDIVVHHLDPSCDTDQKVIQVLDAPKLDRFHRFLRLWRKLKGWKMWELDLVIRHPAIGNGTLDEAFLINLFYFSRLKTRIGGKATVEQLCALFGDLNTETRFTELYERREDALYQQLFLNKRLIKPLDPAFEVAKVDVPGPTAQQLSTHHSVILAVLGIREADLVILKELSKASAPGTPYISDDLTLINLSFLWRHAWLSKALKFKAEEWETILKIFKQDIFEFANPETAWEFVVRIDQVQAAGLVPDELGWLLSADRSAKAATRETDAVRFLTALRKDLQAIQTEYEPVQYSFLAPPRDVENLDTLLASLLQKLNRNGTESEAFLKTLRGSVLLQADVQGLGAAFAFPGAITGAPNNIPISYEPVLRFNGLMTTAQQATLLNDPSLVAVTSLTSYQQAIQDLFEQSGEATAIGLPVGFIFPGTITGAPNNIPIRSESVLRFKGVMTDVQRKVLLSGALPKAVTDNTAYVGAINELFQQSGAAANKFVYAEVDVTLPGGVTLPGNQPSLPIRYNSTTQKLGFTGLMTNAERLALAAAGNPAIAIDELFRVPRLAIKFFEPIFEASLKELPSPIDFKAQLSADLAAKIAYDAEQGLLLFVGIMTNAEQVALHAVIPSVLPAEIAYHAAVNSLASQPGAIAPPSDRIWLTDNDLDSGLPANNTLAKRLANAALKALSYLSQSLLVSTVLQQSSAMLGLSNSLTRRVFDVFAIMPPLAPDPAKTTLLEHITRVFAATSGVVDYAAQKVTFDGWYWANRAAAILKKWKVTLAEFDKVVALTSGAQLLDLLTLPLDDTAPIASLERFLRAGRLLRFRDSLAETEITFLEVLEKLGPPSYTPAQFAADLERLQDAWTATDLEALIASLDLAYPADYLLAESWERLGRAFYFLDNLNAHADTVKSFAAAAMTDAHAKAVKELFRSKFGEETWLTLSAEIQDALRERKRDSLAAYLLVRPQPADAPSGKWENTNDLYAYYLLDVEMGACQLTSRLVQASGSVQLFVQRCFMGLEPEVTVQVEGADGDSAWRWWQWMRKYRVWEANRKVFLWPENWIEPELKKDRSSFFKDLENELRQNEVTPDTVETAFSNYLEKLDGVAQLEIAGFYQEDDGSNTIIHVFGRTTGIEPHVYYYRRYDYRQWTPWEKVDLDIQGDYLIPAVVNKRLFLFWPVFSEVPNEAENSTISTPRAGQPNVPVKRTKKELRLQMAVSDFRQGRWTAKRVSTDFESTFPSHDVELNKTHYQFFAVDRTLTDDSFILRNSGHGIANDGSIVGSNGDLLAPLHRLFEISGCKGVPVLRRGPLPEEDYVHVIRPERAATGGYKLVYDTVSSKWLEVPDRTDLPQNDFTLENQFNMATPGPIDHPEVFIPDPLHLSPILIQTPDLFTAAMPWHLSLFDRWLLDANAASRLSRGAVARLLGTWLPFFYKDKRRSFFVLPSLAGPQQNSIALTSGGIRLYYPEMKQSLRQWEAYFEGLVQLWLDSIVLSVLTVTQRQQLEQDLHQRFPEVAYPPYPDEQVKVLWKRALMRFYHLIVGGWALWWFQWRQFHFKNFYHPFVCEFAKLLNNPLKGIPALMSRETQLKNSGFSFLRTYQPTFWVVEPSSEAFYPREIVDFSPDGAYSSYNWELFFHAPLLIANALSTNLRFEEARKWYHFIFNPLGIESPVPGGSPISKYWITKPFFETTAPQYVQQRIENILRMLAGDTSVPGYSAQAKKALEDQVFDWRTNPFEPHRIANYRTVAYQKTVVMKYLDNLIAWGDYLFRQDSMESINEATQLYIMAAEILGPQPQKIAPQAKPPVESFNELETEFDKFSNALVEVENLVPLLPGTGPAGADSAPLPMLYFCVPQNDKMLGYWDTVADRLYKIRHCMNIEGVVRQLGLFEPPIDPAALVKAIAGGIDLSSALADLSAPLPLYRFNVLLQKANEVCNDVKALGGALLAALEKKDAEAMGLLRQTHEIRLLEAVQIVRERQIEEAKENLAGLQKNKELIAIRRDYYQNIERISGSERLHQDKLEEALVAQQISQIINIAASVAHIVPTFDLGISGLCGTPHATVMFGGPNVGSALQAVAGGFNVWANVENYNANKASINAGHERRWDDWKFQERLANKEDEQTTRSIAAAELRLAIAEKELENHKLQSANARATDEFMRSKYTNGELYQWQVGQISSVCLQSYRLAYDLAKRAERCFRFELGLQDSNYISFGYWDSLKKGLLSGEKLQYDLRRLETAYVEQNRREFDLTKNISLLLLDPLALIKLRETGRCFFHLPEEVFDLDFPGHFFRRIKSVSLTLPCITGPYTSISCTLRLMKNSVRINTASGDNGYPHNIDDQGSPADDDRFVENNIPVKAIAASTAQNDSGVFELSFRDERYLPFEGAGAISDWSLELFSDLASNNPDPASPDFGRPLRQFDYGTISDAILHLKYTAREDAGPFKNGAITHLRDYFSEDGATPSRRIFNLRQEFPSQWQRFLNPINPANGNIFELEMSPGLFSFRDNGKSLKVNSIWLLVRGQDGENYTAVLNPPLPAPPPAGSDNFTLAQANQFGRLHFAQKDVSAAGVLIDPAAPLLKWQLKMTNPANPGGILKNEPPELEDALLVLGYEWE